MIRITDLSAYSCQPDLSVRDALARLNATEHVFQLIVDGDGRLIGTLTDGDVRRALLGGVALDAAVEKAMYKEFLAGAAGGEEQNWSRLVGDERLRTFLPVLEDDGTVAEVLVRGPDTGIGRALIMAGGFGRRLGERTRETPKPLLPVGGRPILDHVLAKLEAAGVQNVYVSVHYQADQIRDFVTARDGRARITLIEEHAPLGTAGALGDVPEDGTAPILVINGDVITRVDLMAFHDYHVRNGLVATIGVARHEVEVPFGVVKCGTDGLFSGIEEKPTISNFVAAGVYYLSPEIAALVPQGRPLDMPALLNQGQALGMKIGVFPIHEYWTDVGRPADLDAADADVRNGVATAPSEDTN